MREQTRIRAGQTARRLAVTAATGAIAATILVAVGSSDSTSRPLASSDASPTDGPSVQSLDVPAAEAGRSPARGGGQLVASLAQTRTESYGMVAVTWRHGTAPDGTKVRVRLRVDGVWKPWQSLPIDLDEGPAAGEEAADVRDGTAPLWVGEGTGVAVDVTAPGGSGPDGIRVDTIDPGADPVGSTVARSAGAEIRGPARFPAMPGMFTRKEWGANESLGDQCWEPIYGRSAKMIFVHHTVNSNDYSRSDGKGIVRSILAYHTQSRGWCDIGYNYLIDRYGRVYVGRAGGARLPVRGAHAGDYNTNSVGVSLIGNFEEARPTKRMKNALVRFIGWRLGTSYAPAHGTVTLRGTEFNRISGHRDAMSTACPGKYVYRWLPRLRDRVGHYLSDYRSPIRKRAGQIGKRTTGQVFRGEAKQSHGLRTDFGHGAMFAKAGLGAHWLTGAALRAYRDRDGTHGRFGFPVTDLKPTEVAGVRQVVFEHGRMYRIGKRQAYTLWGRILIRYRGLGGVAGSLGSPTSNMMPTGGGRRATFTNGSITWDRQDESITVEYV
ncbi:MAG TPA: N-acetylmuramoyl-L-alanine amidase [Nocardioidaceae bacterium]|nr:N-acetylmuramoyl-L-alanine amidase [Nocardioidaceae bacterium]